MAVTGEGGSLTYTELDERAGRLAARLRRLGVGPEVRVALWLDRTVELVVAILGVLKAGGAYIPIDPSYPEDRLRFLLADAGTPVLVSVEGLRGWLDVEGITTVLLDRLDEAGAAPSAAPAADLPESTAYVIYTSGSTGRPKGVPVSHANVARLLAATAEWFRFGESDVWTLFHSYAFDFSVWELWGALLHGGRLVIVPYWVSRSPEEFHDLLVRERVTVLNQTPSAFHQLAAVDEGRTAAGRQQELVLRWVIFGGEALEPRRLADWFARHGDCRPTLVNMYGITETTVHVTFRPLGQTDLERGSVIGVPIPDLYIQMLDDEREPVPLGVAGEIHVGGAGLARGYLGRPALTAERFVPDPFSPWPGTRLYASGDLARRRTDGELEYLGRADQQVKIRGFRIEPGEIEAALASLAGVREAVVVVREDTPGDRRLVAYVAGDIAFLEPGALRRSLQERLPEHMVPAAFVALPTLPLTPNGKLDRQALPAPGWQGPGESYQSPRTPAEEILAGIWAELLALERVGAGDHFFDLGGHSLLATQVMSRVQSAFGVEMQLRDLFEAPVLAALATRVEAALRSHAGSVAPPLVPVPRQGPLPLSFAQQRLWFIDQLEPGSSLYNMPVALRLEGPLSRAVLERSLGEVVRRHETLRTVFAILDGSPVQEILPAASFELPVIDLSGLPEDGREETALALTADEAGRPFDLVRGPLLRGLLLRLSAEDHIAALTLHHIVSDGWSMGILVREATALYEAFFEGRPSPLAELPMQYADFAVWQRSWLRGATLESEISYWRRQLAGLPPLLELPTDRPRPAVQSYRGASRPLRLSAGLTRQAQALALRQGATLFMVLLAAFQAVLARYSGQRDFTVGTLIAGRNRTEIEGLIGFFLNTLALRGDLTGALSFRQLVVQARETALAAHLHQDVPFEKLVEELTPERSLAHTPLFQVMLVLQNTPSEELKIRDLHLRSMSEDKATEHFDLSLVLVEHQGELQGGLKYATDLFDASTVERLVVHYERLLTAALNAPDAGIADLTLLSPAERHQLLTEWNDTLVLTPREILLPDLFAAQVARTPDALAATFEEESLTYAQLATRAERVARHLRKLGCGPESRVGVALERNLDLLISFLGVLQAGAAYVPLDPDYPRERLRHLLEDSCPTVLLTQESLRDRLPVPDRVPVLLLAALPETDGTIDLATQRDLGDDLLAYVIYTSGSTGRPKGAMVVHRGMVNHLWAKVVDLGLEPGCRVAQTASQCFDISVWQLLSPLVVGGSVHIAEETTVHDPELLLRFAARERITVLEVVPSLLSNMFDPLVAADSTIDLSVLEWLLVTGEACPPDLADRWLALAPYTRLLNAYGPTECSDDVTHYERAQPGSGPSLSLPIGRTVANTRIHVLDPTGQPAALGVSGELCVAGRGVGRGYLGLPARTAQVFVPDAWSGEPGARLYRTGDLARWLADGTLEFLGRLDHQTKVRGFRIELGEIEAVLVAQAGVREAAVVAREDTPGDQRLVAYVVGDAAAEALRQSLRERLPEYMVPGALVSLAALPLTPNGKVDRKALPAPEQQSAGESWVAPRTPIEEVLAGIWAELLGLERVGAADDFFDLGGHSLLATRVKSRLRSAFGVEMPLRVFFEAPTLAGLAALIEVARGTASRRLAPPLTPIAPALREGPLPVSFAQQRLWFIDQLEPGSPLYNMPVALRAEGPLDRSVLARTLTEIVRRHETLRTVFASREGEPVQVIKPASSFPLPLVDLSGLLESARETALLTLTGEEAGRPFDLARGPLLRGLLLRLAEREHIVALTMHHIVSDAWSLGILVHEVVALYAAFAAGRPSPLPELSVQYADFAVWQHGWLDQEMLEELSEHWRQRLAGVPAQLDLPGARPRPAVLSPRGAARQHLFPPPLLEQLRALGRRESATLFMTLLAPLQALLHARTGATDLVVGTDVAGRDRHETEGLIGFFINQLPLGADVTGDPTLRELLGRAREMALEAYAYQDLPFDQLVDALRVERSLQRAPVFQVKLVLQNAPREGLDLPGLTFEVVPSSTATAQLDLHWSFVESGDDLWLTLTYSTDLYDEPLIESLLEQYEIWLYAFTERPEARLGEVVAEFAQAERSRRAERGLELRSKGLGQLRSLRRQADSPMEV
ncbi:MAG TPA: amino acid adenylation domain-containing protein [Thermoanaerobaculia bacterium]|nr:amino acid adenylation domain-containing protein [Thermoanaerobaculia bacterium]